MKNKIKSFQFVILLALVACFSFAQEAKAEGMVNFSIASGSGDKGQTVNLDVSINKTGIVNPPAFLQWNVVYDPAVISAFNLVEIPTLYDNSVSTYCVDVSVGNYQCTSDWSQSSMNMPDTLNIATLQFTISNSATVNSTPITISYETSAYVDPANPTDADGLPNYVFHTTSATSGTITIVPVVVVVPDTTKPTVTTFVIPETSASLTVPVTTLTATDDVAVTGYMVSESSTAPTSDDSHFTASAPTSYTFASEGSKTLYAWAKDAAGNVSGSLSDSVNIALPVIITDTTAPIISSASYTSITATGVTITWTTNELSDSQVEYGITNSYGNSTTLNSSMQTSHSQTLTALSSGTTYHFRIKSKDAAGNLAISEDFTFTTPIPVDTIIPKISAFKLSTKIFSPTVVISTFRATDNVGVTGYMLTETKVKPLASDTRWIATAPTSYTFTIAGNKTLYAWTKDAAGNVSNSMKVRLR